MTWGRVSAACYVETYPGVGVGVVTEWVSHNLVDRAAGTLELTALVPFLIFKAAVTVHPRRRERKAR